jgi:hypothetical protein
MHFRHILNYIISLRLLIHTSYITFVLYSPVIQESILQWRLRIDFTLTTSYRQPPQICSKRLSCLHCHLHSSAVAVHLEHIDLPSSSSSALQPGVGPGLPHNAPPFFLTENGHKCSEALKNVLKSAKERRVAGVWCETLWIVKLLLTLRIR